LKRIRATAISAGVLALATLAAFWPVLRNGFVNWDDPTVLVDNPHLGSAGVVSWAFSTTLIGHYQPLSWLVWSAAKSLFGLSPAAFHALGLAVHIANGLVVFALTLRLVADTSLGLLQRRVAAAVAASVFLLHPLSVEAVAWASAFPYVLSSFALLLSFLAYVNGRRRVSLLCYAASLLARATALGYPLILLVADVVPLNRRIGAKRLLVEKAPFAVLAAAAAGAEWYARDVATLQEIGVVPRLTMATTAPLLYLWRMVWPVRLSPLDPLPISPAIAWLPLTIGLTAMIAATALAWRVRARSPLVASAWIVYLILLAPVAGLAPSGVQATADRYMYVPVVVVAIAIGVAVAYDLANRIVGAAAAIATIAAVATCGVLTWNQTRYWKSSVTLWTRAAELDPRNDIATYNLAIALAEAGREDEAIGWYERTLVLVPDHDLARRNRDILQAADAERRADRLAADGHAADASAAYARALALDPKRSHARAARGMLLMRRGELREAVAELRLAMDAGVNDAEVPNALAFALAQTGDAAEAARVLAGAAAAHPDNVNLKHNLARLLATTSDPRVRDGARALRLALEVCDQTANRDPRALDTLSAAYAASGRFDLARATASRAEARARELGDVETATEIATHARGYRR
jgi:tetratricopeptide (TPR) repeat protein